MHITDIKKAQDWLDIREEALKNDDELLWRKIFTDFFWGRLNSRYFLAIKAISDSGNYLGEGFSILAIQCSLIEFLEAIYKGENYRWVSNKRDLNEYEYSGSKECFISFLTKREPFRDIFTPELAKEFYSSVRCGLLHEATTKNGWKVWGKSENGLKVICADNKIVFRNDLQQALYTYIAEYGNKLVKSKELQLAFIRKFDALCS